MYKETKILSNSHDDIIIAGNALREGKLVVFPTETVYGIGANIFLEQSVKDIFTAKGRPQDNPLIVHIYELEQIHELTRDFPVKAKTLVEHFWPGPLTIILPKSTAVNDTVSAGLDTVAIRMPSNQVARELLKYAQVPVAAPSANRSGTPSSTTAEHCKNDLSGFVDYIIDGGSSEIGVESTVISLVGAVPELLRPGAVTISQMEELIGKVEVNSAVLSMLKTNEQAHSPGMKYKHYAPDADVTLVHSDMQAFCDYCNKNFSEDLWAMAFEEDLNDLAHFKVPAVSYGRALSPEEQAGNLFAKLRELDEKGAKKIFIHAPITDGVGFAVYNRVLRAASFNEVYL